MKVTPLDIRRKEFKRSLRGYADEEVDVFLDEVADEFERLFQENAEMQDRLQRMEEQIESHTQIREALEKTLVSAQLQADQVTANARKESELILRDAELKARNIVSDSYSEIQRVQQALVQLKHLEEDFRFKFRSLLEAHLKLLNEAPIAVHGSESAVLAAGVSSDQSALAASESWTAETSAPERPTAEAQPSAEEPVAEIRPQVQPVGSSGGEFEPEPPASEIEAEDESAGRTAAAWGSGPAVSSVVDDNFPTGEVETPMPTAVDTDGPDATIAEVTPLVEEEEWTEGEGTDSEERAPARGFFFGRRVDDLDDSFVTAETPAKEKDRDFEW